MELKKWMGGIPKTCDLCHKELKQQFVDGRTQMGPWGIMCATCHSKVGCGLGLGQGQRYDLQTLNKVAG